MRPQFAKGAPAAMWLLDHNLPAKMRPTLEGFGVKCETAAKHGWQNLKNGELVAAAFTAGYRCILTRDVRFSESASQTLKKFPEMAIVLLKIPQMRGRLYVARLWGRRPIENPKRFSIWP
jgi:predicted nuclease of predicted toxin-antitoxin system